MKIDLKEIGPHGLTVERRLAKALFEDAEDVPAAAGLTFLQDVEIHLQIRRAGERFHLRGTVETRVMCSCSRCLADIPFAVNPAFDYYLVPRRPVEEWAELEIEENARNEVEVDHFDLDILQMTAEQVRLVLPMKLLCREDCRGICPGCGADLNTAACTCEPGADDPRLQGLAGILQRMKDDTPDG